MPLGESLGESECEGSLPHIRWLRRVVGSEIRIWIRVLCRALRPRPWRGPSGFGHRPLWQHLSVPIQGRTSANSLVQHLHILQTSNRTSAQSKQALHRTSVTQRTSWWTTLTSWPTRFSQKSPAVAQQSFSRRTLRHLHHKLHKRTTAVLPSNSLSRSLTHSLETSSRPASTTWKSYLTLLPAYTFGALPSSGR